MPDNAPGTPGQGTDPGAGASSTAVLNSPSTPPVPVTAPTWLGEADETTVGYLQNKGWATQEAPKQILESYRNLEKLLGAKADAVILPKPDASQAEIDAFFNRLGRPADPTAYKLAVPEGGNPEFAKAAAAKMHELGLTQKQGEVLASWYNDQAKTAIDGKRVAEQSSFEADNQALKQEWGSAFAQNLSQAQTAARALDLDASAIDKLQGALGHKGLMTLLQKIGSKSGEPDFVTGKGQESFSGALTPGQAKAKIQELTKDKNFVQRYLAHDASAVAEMKKLHEFANPE